MAQLPDVPVTVKDGGLGVLPTSASRACVTQGVCSGGTTNQIYSFNDLSTLQSTLGQGPLVEAVAVKLAIAGGPQLAQPLNASQAGSASAVTKLGTGAATITATAAPSQPVTITTVVGGVLGTAQFSITVGGNPAFTVLSGAGWNTTGYQIPNTMIIWVPTAGTYVAGGTPDTYTLSTTATTVTKTQGTGPVAGTITSSPLDALNVQIVYTTAGAPGTGAFKYSLDGGNSFSAPIAIPGSGLYAIPNSGLFLTITGSGNVGDLYTFTTTPAAATGTDVTAGFTALLGYPQQWSLGHTVGVPSSSAAAAAIASIVSTQMGLALNTFRFARWCIECPSTEIDTTIATAFANFADSRVLVGVGDDVTVSPISGRKLRRNAAWQAMAYAAATPPGQDIADISLGPVRTIDSLYRDESASGGTLDAARFITLRTLIGKNGYYVTNGRTMAAQGSDFGYLVFARVIDAACTIARAALLFYLNGSVRVDKTSGFIDERDAQRIEKNVNAQLKAGVVDTGDATQATIQLSRTTNILSTGQLPVTCAVIPKGYNRMIPLTVGFSNPALAA